MKDLEPPDIHHVNAAQGWLELNNPAEAQAELDKVTDFKSHLIVMELQWQIHAKTKAWGNAVDAAGAITTMHPDAPFGWIHLAYALHEMRKTREAYDALKLVLDRFPKEWLMRYNMACYAVQMGRLDEGKSWLELANKIGDKKEIAELMATDPDLEPLRKT
ncbi:MAG: tetratricopeptide repeat protein, partial [Limisphaerales bacterium]